MKLCADCKQTFSLTEFVAKASCKDGYEPRCRRCRSIKYNKSTPDKLCKKLYLTQVTHSVSRGHPAPGYTMSEFTAWAKAQPTFDALYSAWQESNYKKELAPSADRINDSQPYSLSNLQLMTWEANRNKGAKSKKDGDTLTLHRGVIAYNKDGSIHKEYVSLAEAMREFGGKGTQSWGITTVCNGVPVKDGKGKYYTPRTYKGFTWKWKD